VELPSRLRWTLRLLAWIGLAFLYVPLLLVLLNAFNKSRTGSDAGVVAGRVA
jgi:ABC-type spermidine/putrescine transport system permease subunit II